MRKTNDGSILFGCENEISLGYTIPNAIEQEIVHLYERNASGMLRYARSLSPRREWAEDAVQEAFLRFFIARSQGQQILCAKAWLYKVMRNYLWDRLKEAGERNHHSIEEIENSVDGQQDLEANYLHAEVMRRVAGLLAPRELECLHLRAEGFDYKDIANILGIKTGTVGATLARALKKISVAVSTPKSQPSVVKDLKTFSS